MPATMHQLERMHPAATAQACAGGSRRFNTIRIGSDAQVRQAVASA